MKRKTYNKATGCSLTIQKGKVNHFNFFVKSLVFIGLFGFTSITTEAQETWSLVKCIDYALENNISIHLAENNTSKQQLNLRESKAQLLPSLNMGSGLNMSYGRTIDGNTNEITFDQTLSNSYYISSSMDIFKGMVKYNTIRFNNYLLSANKEEASYVKNKLVLDILTSYYTVLYSMGLEKVAQTQVSLSEMQYNRMQKLVDVGRQSPITVQDLKSQWASDKLSLIQAQNIYNRNLLELKQLLRLDAGQDFSIDTLNQRTIFVESFPEIDKLFSAAVTVLPEIKQREFLYKASLKNVAIAKGAISPRVYMSAGFYTSYFGGDPLAYQKQISENQNQGISMGISIPIFNNASVASNIKRKKIALQDSDLELQKQKDLLYAEIWKALDELQSSEKEYQSAKELYGFSELTLESATKKMENGLASPSEFEISKQRFTAAKASLLKAQLLYSMRMQIIVFYETGSWNHL